MPWRARALGARALQPERQHGVECQALFISSRIVRKRRRGEEEQDIIKGHLGVGIEGGRWTGG